MMKEEAIKRIVAGMDFKGDYSIADLKAAIKAQIGELPGVQLEHKAATMLSEDKTTTKRIVEVKSITIAYTDGYDSNGTPLFKSLKLYV